MKWVQSTCNLRRNGLGNCSVYKHKTCAQTVQLLANDGETHYHSYEIDPQKKLSEVNGNHNYFTVRKLGGFLRTVCF